SSKPPPVGEGPNDADPRTMEPSDTIASIPQNRPEASPDSLPNEKPTSAAESDKQSNETFARNDSLAHEAVVAPLTNPTKTEPDDEPPTQSAEIPESKKESTSTQIRKPHKKATTQRVANKSRDTQEHHVVHTVKRGRVVPTMHVGRSAAQLVGTTPDGRWILSVADSGQRIIVPPPPGYGE